MADSFVGECAAVLLRTPAVLDSLLRDLPEAWTDATEGEGTWSPYDVVGHLIHGEKTDWIPRLEIILTYGRSRPFDRFDREAQFRESNQRSLAELLDEFSNLRTENLGRLHSFELDDTKLARTGLHPDLGATTARQLLATWAAHDLAHILQISRVMAKRLRSDVGPWAAYLSVMR